MVTNSLDWSGGAITERDPEKMGGVSTVRALRLSADAVVDNHDDGVAPEEIAEMFHVPLDDVRVVIAYSDQVRYSAHSV